MERAVSPAVGVFLLVVITIVLGTTVGVTLWTPELETTPSASLELTAEAEEKQIALTHRGGDSLHVGDLTIRIVIDGEELAEQPPVPFFAADGFDSGPTGPFNSESDNEWRAGETASVRLAGTNAPLLSKGSDVRVVVLTEQGTVYDSSVTAR